MKHGGNEYSTEAHKSIRASKSKLRQEVLSAIRDFFYGATSDEVEQLLNYPHQTVSARMTELKALGLIVPTGEKRKTRGGRNAGVWRTYEWKWTSAVTKTKTLETKEPWEV